MVLRSKQEENLALSSNIINPFVIYFFFFFVPMSLTVQHVYIDFLFIILILVSGYLNQWFKIEK